VRLKITLQILLLVLFLSFGSASANEQNKPYPDTVRVGVYIFSLFNLDFPGDKLNADFYVWYNYKDTTLKPAGSFELVNSTEFSKIGQSDQKFDTVNYSTFRCNSVIKQDWDVSNFPFDKQTIELEIEDIDNDVSKLVFVPDIAGSKIDKDVHLDGWEIKDFGMKVVDHTYESNYGDPSIPRDEYSAYSRVIVYFTIQREGTGLFFKLFVGLFISVLISIMTFFINPIDLDPRFGLPVGAIFAAIASEYVISSTLPQNQRLTLVDILHVISFIYIFICIVISAISLHLIKHENEKASRKLDWYSFYGVTVTYLIIVLYFVLSRL